ncbi:MAG: hypothetical protein V4613_09570 [Bacteroidota bacterium]
MPTHLDKCYILLSKAISLLDYDTYRGYYNQKSDTFFGVEMHNALPQPAFWNSYTESKHTHQHTYEVEQIGKEYVVLLPLIPMADRMIFFDNFLKEHDLNLDFFTRFGPVNYLRDCDVDAEFKKMGYELAMAWDKAKVLFISSYYETLAFHYGLTLDSNFLY